MSDSTKESNDNPATPPTNSNSTLASAAAPGAAVTIDPLAMRQALEVMRPKFETYTDAKLQVIRLDLPSVAMWVLNRLDDIEPYRAKIAQLPFVDHPLIENLEPIALATLEVDSQSKVAVKLPPEVMETYRIATLHRDDLREEALILEKRKMIPKGSLDAVSGDRGYRNTAVELTALGNILRDNWSNIVGKSAITLEEVNQCSVLAQLLFRNADDRLQRAAIPAQLSLLRQQAYTMLVLAYEELRRCMTFLEPPDVVEKIVPTLYQNRGRKPGSGPTEEPLPAEPITPATEVETNLLQELTPAPAVPTAAPTPPAASDPVARAEAAVQAASATTKASKSPFTS